MNFRPELAAKVLAGEKTVTRRLVSDNPRSPWSRARCALVVDRDYAVCPGRGKNTIGRVRILGVDQRRLGLLLDSEARAEGFADAHAFGEAWRAINGAYLPDALVWRVEFELLRSEGADG